MADRDSSSVAGHYSGALVILTRPRSILLVAMIVGFATVAACILISPYASDDLGNQHVREIAAVNHQSLFDVIIHYTNVWIQINGRFFPGSLTWTYGLFWFVDSRIEYKIVITVVLLIAVAVTAALAWVVTKRRSLAVFVAISLIATLQLRVGLDGLTSFASLLSLSTALTLGATVLLIRKSSIPWFIAAGAMYAIALVTYETVLLFLPVLIALVVATTGRWRRSLALVLPAVSQLVIVSIFRMTFGATAMPAYSVSLSPRAVVSTFVNQAVATLPGAQWAFRAEGVPPLQPWLVVIALFAVGVPVCISVYRLGDRWTPVRGRTLVMLGVAGLWMWLAPALLVGVTELRQAESHPGEGYLAVVYGYFGLALAGASVWAGGYNRFGQNLATRRPGVTAWRYASSAIVAIACTVTVAGNLTIAGAFWTGAQP